MESPALGALSIRELKELMTRAGLSFRDCIDRDDLTARAREAVARIDAARLDASMRAEDASDQSRESTSGRVETERVEAPASPFRSPGT